MQRFIYLMVVTILFGISAASCSSDEDMDSTEIFDQDFTYWDNDGFIDWVCDLALRDDEMLRVLSVHGLSSLFPSPYIQEIRVHTLENNEKYISCFGAACSYRSVGLELDHSEKPLTPLKVQEGSYKYVNGYAETTLCFTPGGKKITDRRKKAQIVSAPYTIVWSDRFGYFNPSRYGLEDEGWLNSEATDALMSICNDKNQKYGHEIRDISIYVYQKEGREEGVPTSEPSLNPIPEAIINALDGTPIVIHTEYVTDKLEEEGMFLCREIESFIIHSDGKVSSIDRPTLAAKLKEVTGSETGWFRMVHPLKQSGDWLK